MGKSSTVISEKHALVLDMLEKELAESDIASSDVVMLTGGDEQLTTKVVIVNNGAEEIIFQEKKDWSGAVLGAYPPKIPSSRYLKFVHQGIRAPKGSKGAVIYVGPTVGSKLNDCAYILAWSTFENNNKIYVEAGPSTNYISADNKISSDTWDKIKTSLENSTDTSSYHDDINTGGEASAKIQKTGNNAQASCVFDISEPI